MDLPKDMVVLPLFMVVPPMERVVLPLVRLELPMAMAVFPSVKLVFPMETTLLEKYTAKPIDDSSAESISAPSWCTSLATASKVISRDYIRLACDKVHGDCMSSIENISTSRAEGKSPARGQIHAKRGALLPTPHSQASDIV
ncbi:hypothetical protein SKAU_G00290240 [Synaphobranchus kaupii]|uniref:Uncharacterized protein n=1 Tax=Synaphobranchus kaupii TaxID=118154 RepID=A0A9Q1IMB2_SYNKA|nr:hypothetical protein SKAU_G00290240 [Synaphobranchus kaupii]